MAGRLSLSEVSGIQRVGGTFTGEDETTCIEWYQQGTLGPEWDRGEGDLDLSGW